MTDSTTNHESWAVLTVSEGGSQTRPSIVLPDEPTGRRWRITYEEEVEQK